MEEREGNHFGMFGRLTGVSSGSSSEPSSLSEFLLVGAAVFLLIGVGFVVAAVERDKEEGEEVAVAEPRGLIPKVPPARSFDGLDHGRRCRGVHSSISRLLDLPKRSSEIFAGDLFPAKLSARGRLSYIRGEEEYVGILQILKPKELWVSRCTRRKTDCLSSPGRGMLTFSISLSLREARLLCRTSSVSGCLRPGFLLCSDSSLPGGLLFRRSKPGMQTRFPLGSSVFEREGSKHRHPEKVPSGGRLSRSGCSSDARSAT